jgi:outer membrane protein assembly factor BamD (BamD/ComL family)
LLAEGDEYEALYDYEYVARTFPSSDVFVTALERELKIATRYAAGYNRKFLGMRILGAEDEAEELFIRVQERLPGSRLAEEAGMQLADFYFERRKMSLAAEAYALFIENYPRSERINKAKRRLIYANLASFKGPEFDAAGLYEARAHLQQMRRTQPVEAQRMGAEALLMRIDESDADKMLATARWYLRFNDPIAAELTIRRLVQKYPRSVATADAMRLVPEILPRLPKRVLDHAPDYEAIRSAGQTRTSVQPENAQPAGEPTK